MKRLTRGKVFERRRDISGPCAPDVTLARAPLTPKPLSRSGLCLKKVSGTLRLRSGTRSPTIARVPDTFFRQSPHSEKRGAGEIVVPALATFLRDLAAICEFWREFCVFAFRRPIQPAQGFVGCAHRHRVVAPKCDVVAPKYRFCATPGLGREFCVSHSCVRRSIDFRAIGSDRPACRIAATQVMDWTGETASTVARGESAEF